MRSILAGLPLLFASSIFAQSTWTVSSTDGVSDFATIQSAVDAASDGDTILVRPGTYGEFIIDGKGLIVLSGDGGSFAVDIPPVTAVALTGWATIRNVPLSSTVIIRGMQIQTGVDPIGFTFGFPGMVLLNNAGDIWLEDVDIDLSVATGGNFMYGVALLNSDSVNLVDSSFRGAPGSDGLFSLNSDVFAFESEFRGGLGFHFDDYGTDVFNDGGDGVNFSGGEFFGSDSLYEGGAGYSPLDGLLCGHATSDGGNGFNLANGTFRDRTGSSIAGAGGDGTFCGIPSSSDGQTLIMSNGTMVPMTEPLRGMTTNSPVFEGDLFTRTYYGEPSELVLLTVGGAIAPGAFVPDFMGPLFITGPQIYRFEGLLNGSGTKTKAFTLQDVGSGAFTLYFQPSFFDLGTSTWRTGSPTCVSFVDGSYQLP
ncbi:MAG: hypothetical protein ACI8TQ_002140 [Planctomycetota bacterium]|jgi:hypothetical protein